MHIISYDQRTSSKRGGRARFYPAQTKSPLPDMYIWLILNLGISTVVAKDYVAVSVCPSGPLSWQIQEENKKCRDPTPDYICAAVANSSGYGEICSNLDRDIPSGMY